MLAVYGLVYLVFMLINVFAPRAMGAMVFLGLNLAIVYGFGLILLAFVMAIIYNSACTKHEVEVAGRRKA